MSTTETSTLKTTTLGIIKDRGGHATVADIRARLHGLGQPKSPRRIREVLYCCLAEGTVSRSGRLWHYPREPVGRRMAAARSSHELALDDQLVDWLFSCPHGVTWEDVVDQWWESEVSKPHLLRAWERVVSERRAERGADGRWSLQRAMGEEELREAATQLFRVMQERLPEVKARLARAGLQNEGAAFARRIIFHIVAFDWAAKVTRDLASLVVLGRGWNACGDDGEMANRFERQVDDIVQNPRGDMRYLDLWNWLEEAAEVVPPPPSVLSPHQNLRAPDGCDEPACPSPPALAANS